MLPLRAANVVPSDSHIEAIQEGFQLLKGQRIMLSVPVEKVLQKGGRRDGRLRRGCGAGPNSADKHQQGQEQHKETSPRTHIPEHGKDAKKQTTSTWDWISVAPARIQELATRDPAASLLKGPL